MGLTAACVFNRQSNGISLQKRPVSAAAFRQVVARWPLALPTAPRKSSPTPWAACGVSSLREGRGSSPSEQGAGRPLVLQHDGEVQAPDASLRKRAAYISR